MKLPRAEEAIVPQRKVEDYLLNPEHRVGAAKARFFAHFGFSREGWQVLADALKQHALEHPVARSFTDDDGEWFVLEGPLQSPSRRLPRVRTVRLLDSGALAPRFITAYPLDE